MPALLSSFAILTGFHLDNLLRATVFQGNSILFLIASASTLLFGMRQEKLPARYALSGAIVLASMLSLLVIFGLVTKSVIPVDPREAFFLLILCHFAIALFTLIFVKERAEATLTTLLDTDTLTQIHNRRWFFSRLPPAPRTGDAFIIVDIDHFKRVNDTFGHAAGDAVLSAVASAMSQALQRGEILARLGGEEFGIYLPEALRQNPYDVAEALRRAIQALDIRHGDARISVTISAGIAVALTDLPMKEFMGMADAALYSAKNLGRNRIEKHELTARLMRAALELQDADETCTNSEQAA